MKGYITLRFSNVLLSIAVFSFLLSFSLNAQQTHEWVGSFTGAENVTGLGLVTDQDENVYSTGFFHGTADFDPGAGTFNLTSPDQQDIYVSKLDSDGNFVWAFRLGNTARNRANSITIDQNGDLYVTGYFEGTVDFDPGAGNFNMTSDFIVTAFLLKIDQDGNFLWARKFNGVAGFSEGVDIAVDNNNDVVLGGYFQGDCDFNPLGGGLVYNSPGSRDGFVVKHNSNGDFIWVRHLDGDGNVQVRAIATDSDNNVICGGFFFDNVDFDNETASESIETGNGTADNDILIGKYSPNGDYLWSHGIGAAGDDRINGLDVNIFGNIFATGRFRNTVDFDPSTETAEEVAEGLESYVWSLNNDGLFNWVQRIGGSGSDEGQEIAIDEFGSVYATGFFNTTADFDDETTMTSLGGNTIYVAKYFNDGTLDWTERMGGPSSDVGFGVYVSGNWNILTTGLINGSADFDPDGTNDVLTATATDAFVHKFNQTCVAPTISEVIADTSICVTPEMDVVLTVRGELKDAEDWYWYSGSCGGTLVGTDSIITVNPSTTTTYFVRAEGGCEPLPPCESIIIEVDDEAPVITTAGPVIEDVEPGACYYISDNLTFPTVTDNCTVDTIYNNADLLLFPGIHTITWTAIDQAGNIAQETQQVTVEDNESPSINAPADVSVSADANCEANGVSLGSPLAVDNCSVDNITNDAPATFPIGQTIVTWTAEDPSGNIGTDQQIVTVVDDIDPIIVDLPDNMTISVNPWNCLAIVSWTEPTVDDNCPGATITKTAGPTNDGSITIGVYTVEYTAEDASGNTVVESFTITIVDNENPTITAPDDVTVSANNFCNAFGVDLGTPVTNDNCSVASVTNDAPPIYSLGTTLVTWTVTDGSGNTSTATQNVIVIDDTDPTITAPSDITVNVDPASCEATINELGNPTTADNCSVDNVSNDAPATFPVGTTTVTWTVEDGSGNTATDNQIITVIDNIDPVIFDLPSDTIISNDSLLCGAEYTWIEPSADDNCPGVTIIQTAGFANGDTLPVGVNTIIYTATDASGNNVSASFTVTVIDDEDPTIIAPADTIIEANHFCSALNVILDNPITDDNCGIRSITNDAPVIFGIDTTIVTWTVTDDAGNTAVATQLVIVADSTAPVVTPPLPVTAYVDENCEIEGSSIDLGWANATDNCAVDTIYNDLPDTLTTGKYIVTWFAEDNHGNIGTATQILTLVDTIPPTPVLTDTVITLSPDGPILVFGEDIDLGSFDNCGIAEVILDQEVFDCDDLGVNTIGVRVIDVNGNVTDTSIVVEVLESGIDLDFDGIDDACDDDVNTTVVEVPSGFTPNGDGINDLFVITALSNYSQVELYVYNRYGNLVYENQQYENNWDGTSSKNGMELPDGTYFYVLKLDGQAEKNGYVYINRTL